MKLTFLCRDRRIFKGLFSHKFKAQTVWMSVRVSACVSVCVCAVWLQPLVFMKRIKTVDQNSCGGTQEQTEPRSSLHSHKKERKTWVKKNNNNNNRCLLPPFTNLCRMCLSCLTLFILISVLLLFQSSLLTGVKTHRKLLPQWDSHIFRSLGICALTGDAPLCEPCTSPHTNSLTNQPPDTLFSRHS